MAGVAALFVEASVQLGRRGVAAMRGGLEPLEWVALALLTVAFIYGEGVRALARRWVPAMIARATELGPESRTRHRVLAPLYAMGLMGGSGASRARAAAGVLLIVAAVMIVRRFPEPWRGIVDFAVAAALLVGLGAIVAGALGARRAGSGR